MFLYQKNQRKYLLNKPIFFIHQSKYPSLILLFIICHPIMKSLLQMFYKMEIFSLMLNYLNLLPISKIIHPILLSIYILSNILLILIQINSNNLLLLISSILTLILLLLLSLYLQLNSHNLKDLHSINVTFIINLMIHSLLILITIISNVSLSLNLLLNHLLIYSSLYNSLPYPSSFQMHHNSLSYLILHLTISMLHHMYPLSSYFIKLKPINPLLITLLSKPFPILTIHLIDLILIPIKHSIFINEQGDPFLKSPLLNYTFHISLKLI